MLLPNKYNYVSVFLVGDDGNRLEYTPEISKKAIREIIQREMERQNVKRSDIRRYRHKYPFVKGFAWFTCTEYHKKEDGIKQWSSAHAWCRIDLKRKRIGYRFFQGCKKDYFKDRPKPEFTEEAIKKMAKYAVQSFKIRNGLIKKETLPSTDTLRNDGGRHDERLCVMCRKRKRPCWKKRIKSN